MDGADLIQRAALALGIGLLFGVERGWRSRDEPGGTRAAGIRAFALMGLLGGIGGALAQQMGVWVLVTVLAAAALLLTVGYVKSLESRPDPDRGLTTEIAGLLCVGLGAYAVIGDMALAAAAAVVAVALLDMKAQLHGWIAKLERLELQAALKLLVVSVVLLSVLPNQGYGPGEVLNPYVIWWMVVLIAALSFTGYVAVKLIGPRFGPLATGLLGGIASSTAVTLSFSRLARRSPGLAPSLAGGIAVASAVMYVRVLAIAVVVEPALLQALAVPVGTMAIVGAAGAMAVVGGRGFEASAPTELPDPSEISTAIQFGLLLAAVLLLSHLAQQWIGVGGVYLVAAGAGVADVDATTLSMSRLAGDATGGITPTVAATAVVIAMLANTLAKALMVAAIGGARVAARATSVLCLAGVAGLIALLSIG